VRLAPRQRTGAGKQKGQTMDQQFVALTRALSGMPSRRHLLRGLAAAGLGLGVGQSGDDAAVGKKRNHKNKKRRKKNRPPTGPLCTGRGEPCTDPGPDCRESFCLRAPFTIAATWQSQANHDTWLIVPPKDETTGPSPQIDYDCNQTNSPCAAQYPFACVSNDDQGPGNEITTIYQRLPGRYEYWISSDPAPAGELTITLTDRDGRMVRTWSNPAITSAFINDWHVFDLDGATGRVTSVDAPPGTFPVPHTNVCPV
jgi:hypothetical protein